MNLPKSTIIKEQTLRFKKELIDEDGYQVGLLQVRVEYDDQLNNGHNTFSIVVTSHGKTDAMFDSSAGYNRETSAILIAHFPELHKYLKWHLVSSEGSMHYLANTIWQAGDVDCNGRRKGEIQYGRKQVHINRNVLDHKDIHEYDWHAKHYHGQYLPATMARQEAIDAASGIQMYELDEFENEHGMLFSVKRRVLSISEGKEPDLEAARRTAIWPDGTLEQLRCRLTLDARLPALMEEFKRDMQELFGPDMTY